MRMLTAVAAVGMWACSETSAEVQTKAPDLDKRDVVDAWNDFGRVCDAIGLEGAMKARDKACFETVVNGGQPPGRILELSLQDPVNHLPRIRRNIADRCKLVDPEKLAGLGDICK